jgi:hypothetical protein
MKNLFITLAMFLLVITIGCQENMLNEPANTLMKDKGNDLTSDVAETTNILKLKYNLRGPEGSTFTLQGRVTYTHSVVTRAMDPLSSKMIALHIYINASLIDIVGMAHLDWRIEGRSDDLVSVSEDGILLLEKTYSITNRNDVVLLVKYLVTTNGVGIADVRLVQLEK